MQRLIFFLIWILIVLGAAGLASVWYPTIVVGVGESLITMGTVPYVGILTAVFIGLTLFVYALLLLFRIPQYLSAMGERFQRKWAMHKLGEGLIACAEGRHREAGKLLRQTGALPAPLRAAAARLAEKCETCDDDKAEDKAEKEAGEHE